MKQKPLSHQTSANKLGLGVAMGVALNNIALGVG